MALPIAATPVLEGEDFEKYRVTQNRLFENAMVLCGIVLLGFAPFAAEAQPASKTKIKPEIVKDSRNGKKYKTIKIGNQTWMAQNLNYAAEGSVCYDNNNANCDKYGRLYNWNTAAQNSESSDKNPGGVRGVCPAGWHLPSDAEWAALVDYAGGEKTAGKQLKAADGCTNNGNGTNEHGFSALPCGGGDHNGGFYRAGDGGLWWSATETDAYYAYYREMSCNFKDAFRVNGVKTNLFSVRCLQD